MESLNVYSFYVTITSADDRRKQKKIKHEQAAFSLAKAFDLTEETLRNKFPGTEISLSSGNRQPVQLRQRYINSLRKNK